VELRFSKDGCPQTDAVKRRVRGVLISQLEEVKSAVAAARAAYRVTNPGCELPVGTYDACIKEYADTYTSVEGARAQAKAFAAFTVGQTGQSGE
jgi:hypothetical protein